MPAGITRQIGTRFTVSGFRDAVAGFRRVATNFRDSLSTMRDNARRYFAPITAGLQKIAAFSFKPLQKAASVAFKGIAAGAVLASLKIKAIAAAALESSRGIAELMNQVGKDGRRLGASAEDISALRFGFEKQGVDADEVLSTLSDIGNEFKAVQEDITRADEAYARTKKWNFAQAVAAGKTPAAIAAAMAGNLEAAPSSLAGIADQQAFIRQQIIRSAPGEDAARLRLVQEWKDLEAARLQLRQGLGQQAQALFTLQDYGLDFDRAIKGGVEGLTALSEAFVRVEDPQTKLRVSMQLFGEDMGARMVTVLESGRQGIEEYRKEVERLGGVVTAADAKLGADYSESLLRTKTALQGVRLELARGILPLLMDSQAELTEWLVKNRTWIAESMRAAFIETRNLFLDIVNLLRGNTSGFRNSWIEAMAPGLIRIAGLISDIQEQLGKLFDGRDSDWKWLNLLRDGIISTFKLIKDSFAVAFGGKAETFPFLDKIAAGIRWIYAAVMELPSHIKKAWSGIDTDWDWLNSLRDGLFYIRDLAVDVWSVLTGGDAKRFGFLNDWSRDIREFASKVKDAFGVVKDAFDTVHSGAQWLISFVGGDATTIALVGIFAKIAIAITGIGTAARGAWWLVRTLLTLGGAGAAAGAAGAVGAGTAAVGAAGAAAVGGGLSGLLLRIGTQVAGLIKGFGALGTVVAGVLIGGKAALAYSEKSGDDVIAKTAEVMRAQAELQLEARHRNLLQTNPDYAAAHWNKVLKIDSLVGPTEAGKYRRQLEEIKRMNRPAEEQAAERAAIMTSYQNAKAANAQRTYELNINVANQQLPVQIKEENLGFLPAIERYFRGN